MKPSLLTEAVVVGVGLVPVYALTDVWTKLFFTNMTPKTREYVTVFFAGGLFHVICEGTGINDWYLDNGYAVWKRLETEHVEWYNNLNDPALCDGSCGWKDDGLCSHYSIHTEIFYN